MTAIEFCRKAQIDLIESKDFAADFCRLRMEFFRKYQMGIIFPIIGIDFFLIIEKALADRQWRGKGIYDDSIKKWLEKIDN
jgi:hypothetical protein